MADLFPAARRPQDLHDPGGKVRLKIGAEVVSRAEFSDDGRYRTVLERRWDGQPFGSPGVCAWIMMNPSTADENVDDPTVRRARDFTRRWGFGAMVVLNAFALRATRPAMLLECDDPVGPGNDAAIAEWAARAERVVVAWGLPPKPLRWRATQLAGILARAGAQPLALRVTADGQPGHPLYIAGDTLPQPWAAPSS
ncbi:DUF1643 domain-containing protein [Roseomonas sp. SSH11]|uniref:DUF1643 domain-containing protein n=1 Tax=Pararoseomonas baculiformis TaxID=2820812 RepID=A0ABS4AAX4_9PROT|nr:DUF1643 domain-containing protein [Pararoseomonas baculiformis]MBP0444151.1 DUF1643 domain-containing protein [Pararoseomonas baculiformis]